ncbi:MAG TPA: hypothetical protein VKN99_25990 [Polyangia bacterium]|nr:hypothetical protein [Polyangia bacterium]
MNRALTLLVALSLLGCRSEENRVLMGSGRAPPLVVHAARAADPAEFGKIVRMPAREVAARLGAFRSAEGSQLRVTLAGKLDALDESVKLEVDGQGQWHGWRENSREAGVEAWMTGDALVVRMRYSKPVLRRAESSQADELRENLFGDAAAYWELIERFAQLSDEGAVQVAGRPARRVRISLRGSPRSADEPPQPERKWRQGVVVRALAGSALIDQQTGVPLALAWTASYAFPKAGQQAQAEIALKRELADVGAAIAVEAPRDAVPSPVRTRSELERRELLDGLVPDRKNGAR